LWSRHFLCCCLYTFAAHNATNATYNEQNDVIQHLGKGLVHRSHRLQWLYNKCQAVQHESNDASQNQRDNDNDKTPDTGFKFFSGQMTLRVLVLVMQFASPIQGLQGNQGSLVRTDSLGVGISLQRSSWGLGSSTDSGLHNLLTATARQVQISFRLLFQFLFELTQLPCFFLYFLFHP
jgi:hypothetical protein